MPTSELPSVRRSLPSAARLLILFAIALLSPLLFAPHASAQDDGQIWLPVVAGPKSPLESPWPSHWMFSVSAKTWLTWDYAGDDTGVYYNVWLDDTPPGPDTQVAVYIAGNFLDLPMLKSGWRYYWRVDAILPGGAIQKGPVWTFRTEVEGAAPTVGSMIPVPEGEFQMGCDWARNGGFGCRNREEPLHSVYLDKYEIDKYEVTNGQYAECVASGDCAPPLLTFSRLRDWYYGNPEFNDYPVLYVSWWDATDYCAFAGKRLPTEAEWEKAARGPFDTRPWPWGDEVPNCTLANVHESYEGENAGFCVQDTSRVGDYPLGASMYGVMDLAGNAFEWVYDGYDEDYYKESPYMNPQGPVTSHDPKDRAFFVIRGGSHTSNWYYPRTFNRHWGHHGPEGPNQDTPWFRNDQVGFRCARTPAVP